MSRRAAWTGIMLCLMVSLQPPFARVRRRKLTLQLRKKQVAKPSISMDRPLLPWNAAMSDGAVTPNVENVGNLAKQATIDALSSAAGEAAAQQLMLGPGVALAPSSQTVSAVEQQGVAPVQGVLSQKACHSLRTFVLDELPKACRAARAQPSQKFSLFSRDIRETQASTTAPETRFELQLPRTDITESALVELLQGRPAASR